jgi:hypothetical protein
MECLMVVLLFVLMMVLWESSFMMVEGFSRWPYHYFDSYTYSYCPDCDKRMEGKDCLKCSNCGYCETDDGKKGSCVVGNANGPYLAKDCKKWHHNEPNPNYSYGMMYPMPRRHQFRHHIRQHNKYKK